MEQLDNRSPVSIRVRTQKLTKEYVTKLKKIKQVIKQKT